MSADKSKLLGAVLVGDAKEYNDLLQMMLNGMPVPAEPESLIMPGFAQARAAQAAAQVWIYCPILPPFVRATMCLNLTSAKPSKQVRPSLGALKKCTKAATACGGCAPLVTQVLKAELTRQGVTVNNHLCEHFPYSRQELYHLVRVNEIKSLKT